MGSSGLEPPTSRLSGARSNLLSYEPVRGTALRQTFWEKFFSVSFQKLLFEKVLLISLFRQLLSPFASIYRRALFIRLRYLYAMWLVGATDWRWWDSNPWPPACRAGALPTELHPRKGRQLRLPQSSLKIEQQYNRTPLSSQSLSARRFSLERRWSSRTFRYGYLVTT